MRNIPRLLIFIFVLQLLCGCNSDAAPECFKTAGSIVTYNVAAAPITGIHISQGIELIIAQGNETKITIETGQNLKDKIDAVITDSTLYITNNTGCNWVRDYNITKVYVTTPVLQKIYSGSQFAVKSVGVLSFPSLLLQSGITGETPSGTFELTVNSENLTIEDNQELYCKIEGSVNNLTVNYYSGDARFDGGGLIAQKVNVFHRSSNNITINPQQEVRGKVSSTGNLILKNNPPVVEVEKLYTGKVIIE